MEWFTIAALLSLLLSIGLAGKIRTFHVPELGNALQQVDKRASLISDWAVFGLEKWIVRLQGGDPTKVASPFEKEAEDAAEEETVKGLPINEFCEPLGSSEVIEFVDLIYAVQGVKNAKPIAAHCLDSQGREIIQVRDNEGNLPVYTIQRDDKGGVKEFIKL